MLEISYLKNRPLNSFSTIEDVVKILRRSEKISSFEELDLEHVLSQFPYQTVNLLTLMDSSDWQQIDLPLICKLLLKKIMKQCAPLKKLFCIESEFNGGRKINLYPLNRPIEYFVSMGYDRFEALKALVATNLESKETALKYLSTKKESIELQKNFLENCSKHYSLRNRLFSSANTNKQTDTITLEQNIFLLKKRLLLEIRNSEGIEEKIFRQTRENEIDVYCAFLEGIISASNLNVEFLGRIDKYRRDRNINKEVHYKSLKKLGTTEEALKNMTKCEDEAEIANNCSICFEGPKTHLILGKKMCMHLCLCGKCSKAVLNTENPRCPVCFDDIVRIQMVKFE
ncbi:hypothetical protein MHBO_001995 [Bonamia ostreae]|uniref:RING-type domain-containing protein n=1 Tax=Bonamia ostreae TaxID=126728 RepID=A0ABV2AKW9_9EUKA